MILVRLINEHCYEVIAYADELSLLLSQEAMLNSKRAGEIEEKRQQKIIKDNDISYGGLPVNEIFSEQDNTVFVTFKVGKYRSVKKQNPIYIVDDEKYVLNESYIFVPEFRFSNQSLKLYAPKNKKEKAFEKLIEIIDTDKYWEKEDTSTTISETTSADSTFGILDVIGKNDDELAYSNWLGYYLKNYPHLAEQFAYNILGITLHANNLEAKREYQNIDLWLEDDNSIVVIENKIKSGINGVNMERHDLKSELIQSQLSKYYSFAEEEAKKKNKQTYYYILLPDYSYKNEDLSIYLMADKYTVVRYSEISAFFEKDIECLYLDEFRKALKKHSTPYYKDLYQVMEERFVNKIRQKKKVITESDIIKEYKYLGMAEIIRDYLITLKGMNIVRLTAKEARKLDGMDEYAKNTCYNNVGRAMEYVAEHYVYGKQVPGTERGKGNSSYAFDFDVNKLI